MWGARLLFIEESNMSEFNQNGVISIRLVKVTPNLKALFADYEQTELIKGSTDWELRIKPGNSVLPDNWLQIHSALENLCAELGCKPEGATRIDILLIHLGYHLSQQKEKKKSGFCISFPAVLECVQNTQFDTYPKFEDLFRLAQVFNDGHGMQSIEVGFAEFSESSSFPGRYHGQGYFVSKHINLCLDSDKAFNLGQKLDDALARNKLDNAFLILREEIDRTLSSLSDLSQRQQLRSLIAEALSE